LDFDGAKIRRNGYRDCQLRERLLTLGSLCDPSDDCTEN
jgi:hypothetical protein